MAVNNSTILAKAWLNGTNDFQQRIPDPSISGVAATSEALRDPMNRAYFNQFMDVLINRIGWTYVRSQRWNNPLAALKGAQLQYGSTIQEIVPKWIKGHSYSDWPDNGGSLLNIARPEAEVLYHTVNRRDQYLITINEAELEMAFTDEMGLNKLIAGVLEQPRNADEYDEYKLMMELIGYYEKNWTFFKYHVDEPVDKDSATRLLKAIRAIGGKLRFPSTLYNGIPVPVFANSEDLILMVTPEVQASLDVDALAQLFNIDRAEVPNRIILVDEFPIPGAQALLTSKDFFVVSDKLYNTTSFYNPQTLNTNYWLNHWEIMSCTPAVPAVLFTTDESTTTPVITTTPKQLLLNEQDDAGVEKHTIVPGATTKLVPHLDGDIKGVDITDPDNRISVRPNACTWDIVAKTADGKPVQLNMRTRVDEYGFLHVQKTGLTPGDVITVTAHSTYIDPSHASEESKVNLTASLDFTVMAPVVNS